MREACEYTECRGDLQGLQLLTVFRTDRNNRGGPKALQAGAALMESPRLEKSSKLSWAPTAP